MTPPQTTPGATTAALTTDDPDPGPGSGSGTGQTRPGVLYPDWLDPRADPDLSDPETLAWTEAVPDHKLWVHPTIPVPAADLADTTDYDPDDDTADIAGGRATVDWTCPACDTGLTVYVPVTYGDFRQLEGVADCSCGEPQFAQDAPPTDWTPPTPTRTTTSGRARGRARGWP